MMVSESGQVSRPEDIPLNAVPLVCEGIAFEKLALDAREGFVLSRLDGRTKVKHLINLTGLGRDETLALLAKLHDKGVVTWHGHKAATKPAESAKEPAKSQPVFSGVPESEEAFAAMVDYLFEHKDQLTYYELLGVGSSATSSIIKKAYLQRSKSFHPDRFFRRGEPEFRKKLEEIFKQINLAYRELSDPVRRSEYDAELREQDAGKTSVEISWEKVTTVAAAAGAAAEEKKKIKVPPKPTGPKLKLDFSKSKLERQIEEKLKTAGDSKEVKDKLAQALRFYQGALVEIGKKNLKSAEINLKLAIQYDPHNPTYPAEMERIKQLHVSMEADIHFSQGQEAEEAKDYKRAMKLYSEALRSQPENHNWLYSLAKVVYEQEQNYERARALLLKAIDQKKGDPEYHYLLGLTYLGLGQKQPAYIQFKKTLEYNPKHKSAAKELKVLGKKS